MANHKRGKKGRKPKPKPAYVPRVDATQIPHGVLHRHGRHVAGDALEYFRGHVPPSWLGDGVQTPAPAPPRVLHDAAAKAAQVFIADPLEASTPAPAHVDQPRLFEHRDLEPSRFETTRELEPVPELQAVKHAPPRRMSLASISMLVAMLGVGGMGFDTGRDDG